MRRACGNRGFTLVEVMIAVSIMSVLMMTALTAMKMASDTLAVDILDNMVYSSLETVTGEICEDLQCARVSPLPADGAWINFQVPVDLDGDGTVFAGGDTGLLELGVSLGGMPRRGSVTYRFVATNTVSESLIRRDVNGNGNPADVFDIGHILKTMSDPLSGWTLTQKRGNGFVQLRGAYGGDMDGDGNPDPIFAVSGDTVTVSLWSLGVDPRVEPRLANSTATVCTK